MKENRKLDGPKNQMRQKRCRQAARQYKIEMAKRNKEKYRALNEVSNRTRKNQSKIAKAQR